MEGLFKKNCRKKSNPRQDIPSSAPILTHFIGKSQFLKGNQGGAHGHITCIIGKNHKPECIGFEIKRMSRYKAL